MKKTPWQIVPPADTPEFMHPAYFACMFWAIEFEPILNSFTEDTGIQIPKPPSPFEAMIDKATGHDPYDGFIRAFVPWFDVNVWGEMGGEGADE